MEAELASGAEPQLENKERSEAEVFESPGNPKDKSLGSEEKPKSAPKSFFPPGAEKASQESAAKSSGSAKSVPATPRKTQVSPSERSELQQNPQSAPGSNQAVVLASTEVVKTPETSAAMVVSNVQGMSNGPQYAENDSGRAHQVVSVEATPAAQSNVSSVPLFDESQIRRFQEIYNQAPWLYPGNQLLGPPAMVPQPIARPLFLEQDERRVHGVGMVGDQASYLFPYMPQPGPSEHAELRRELERIMEENQKLRARIETLESMRVDDDQKFSTPEEPK